MICYDMSNIQQWAYFFNIHSSDYDTILKAVEPWEVMSWVLEGGHEGQASGDYTYPWFQPNQFCFLVSYYVKSHCIIAPLLLTTTPPVILFSM